MYQIRNKIAPLTFSVSFEKCVYPRNVYTPETFHNLTIKFLKPHLAKTNSESDLEVFPSGITFSKILKKKLPLFKS